ncbi:unnamed protein product [Chrysoparadoxa australica]
MAMISRFPGRFVVTAGKRPLQKRAGAALSLCRPYISSSGCHLAQLPCQRVTAVRRLVHTAFQQQAADVASVDREYEHQCLNLYGQRNDDWWTGKKPSDCPGMQRNGSLVSLPQLNLSNLSRQALLDYFDNTWTMTEVLFASLQGEESFIRLPAHNLRHPMLFYYCHVASLYINKLRVAGLIKEPINEYFECLFETGVDEMRWDDLSKNHMEWPSIDKVHAYRARVYDTVRSVILSAPEEDLRSIMPDSPYWALPMSFEHERIHLETSSVLLRQLPHELLLTPEAWPPLHPSLPETDEANPKAGKDYPEPVMIPVQGGTVTLGKPDDFPSFGWDNEYGSRTYQLGSFKAGQAMCTNGEFLEFVRDKGYSCTDWWSEEGWQWRAYANAKHPCFWSRLGPAGLNQFRLRTVFEEVPMPWSWPVEVNYHEAAAYAAWRSQKARQAGDEGEPFGVTSELHHHLMRDDATHDGDACVSLIELHTISVEDDAVMVAGAGDMASSKQINANLSYGSSCDVKEFPCNRKGFYSVQGNAWEWCQDHFSALEGFNVSPLYEDFSTPCFDGEHHVIMGGSWASTGNEASRYARFHFRPHFHQHAGFRLVQWDQPCQLTSCTDAPGPYVGTYPFRSMPLTLDALPARPTRSAPGQEGQEESMFTVVSKAYLQLVQQTSSYLCTSGAQFPQRCAQLLMQAAGVGGLEGCSKGKGSCLEVGSSVGGASFELSKGFAHVVGVEGNRQLYDTAEALKRRDSLAYSRWVVIHRYKKEGDISVEAQVQVGPTADVERCTFKHCDPMCIPPSLTDFDAVLVHGILDELPSPSGLLSRVGGPRGLVKHGGVVCVVSAYDWSGRHTPRTSWLSGTVDADGNELEGEQGIRRALGDEFELVSKQVVPMTVGMAARKATLVMAEATVWRRH